ncbi:MAG: cell division protein FtsA [Neisseriaceae bacterium]|nr:cell division protein FtsA [Neisseriaceae bacterium]
MRDSRNQHLCALDIGTSKIVALIGEITDDGELNVIGKGEAPSRGMRNGMITNIDVTSQAIKQAVDEAELMADCSVHSVTIGITGSHLGSLNNQGVVKIKEGEVSQADIDRAIETARAVSVPPDHTILHCAVQEYIIDNQQGVRDPKGMSGTRLDTRVHIVTGASSSVQNIEKCVHRVGLAVDAIVLQPLASADAVLTEDDKELGVCCLDIGSGTTDITVFTGGAVRHTAVIPVAGDLITRDLAQALRTPHMSAEYIKINHGIAIDAIHDEDLDEMIEVPSVGDRPSRQISRRNLAAVIAPRVEELFCIVINELSDAGFPEEQLASGIILTGGTSMLSGIVELAEDVFNLPVRIGVPDVTGFFGIRNPKYATVLGLLRQAYDKHLYVTYEKTNTPWLEKMADWFRKYM